jgi:tetratricopeptide (TPR) repeat protein
MMPDALGALNQQFQQGCYVAQQAAMAEQMGNVFAACQLYDQAIGLIANTIGMATQYGIPVTDNVFFSVAYCHFNAARLKAAAGWPQAVPAHLNFALQAVSQAIAINPNIYLYHSGAGLVLLAMSNVPAAMQEFERAVQLNPADSFSHWMLSSLHTAQGNTMAANQYYAAALSAQPNLPPPQFAPEQNQVAPSTPGQGGQNQGAKHDWFGLINNALQFGNNVMGMMGKASQGQSVEGGGQPNFNWSGY